MIERRPEQQETQVPPEAVAEDVGQRIAARCGAVFDRLGKALDGVGELLGDKPNGSNGGGHNGSNGRGGG